MRDRIIVEDLSISFRLYYDRNLSLGSKTKEILRRLQGKFSPDMFHALQGVNFKASEGDIIGVIGPNGSGKTTLLRAICGVYTPDEGRVDVFGKISTLLSLGTGFDNNLSGIDNIRLNGLILGMSEKEVEEYIPKIIEFADIGDHIHQSMHYYSNGMISRLSFAIVVAMQPDILVIDEILSVGDLEFSSKSEKTMKRLMDEASCQIIVSHNLEFLKNRCTHILYISSGRVVDFGPPKEIIDAYVRTTEKIIDAKDKVA